MNGTMNIKSSDLYISTTHTHTQNAWLCFHCSNVYTNAPQCYVIRTLSVVLNFLLVSCIIMFMKL